MLCRGGFGDVRRGGVRSGAGPGAAGRGRGSGTFGEAWFSAAQPEDMCSFVFLDLSMQIKFLGVGLVLGLGGIFVPC
jgi:hypothetical protein